MEGCVGFLLVVVIIGGAIWFIVQYNEEQNRLAAAEAARRAREEAERQRDLAEQARYLTELNSLNQRAIEAFEVTPQTIEAAERHLDRAEEDFADGAFAPFWDSVERAATSLGACHEKLRLITDNSSKYAELSKKYRGKAGAFAVSPKAANKLKLAAATSDRMNGVVRKAQRNFQFSVIYEQRKTNQILVAGFRSLAEALDEMTWRITSSVDNLATSINKMSSTLDESLRAIHSQTEKIASVAQAYQQDAAARAAREEKALEMLDNIQRKRHPSALHGGLR